VQHPAISEFLYHSSPRIGTRGIDMDARLSSIEFHVDMIAWKIARGTFAFRDARIVARMELLFLPSLSLSPRFSFFLSKRDRSLALVPADGKSRAFSARFARQKHALSLLRRARERERERDILSGADAASIAEKTLLHVKPTKRKKGRRARRVVPSRREMASRDVYICITDDPDKGREGAGGFAGSFGFIPFPNRSSSRSAAI